MKKAKAIVEPGACRLTVIIMAECDDQNLVNISFHGDCKHVTDMKGEFVNLNWRKGIFAKMVDSYIYQVCSEHLIHVDCPVPSAILKTIQVLVDAAVEQNVSIIVAKVKNG